MEKNCKIWWLFTSQNLFKAWLSEKEKILREVQTSKFKDPGEINVSVRSLAVSVISLLCRARLIWSFSLVGPGVADPPRPPCPATIAQLYGCVLDCRPLCWQLLKEDMENKRKTMDQLSDAGQDVSTLLRSAEATQRILDQTEELTQRWDNLVQELEDCSYQVSLPEGFLYHGSFDSAIGSRSVLALCPVQILVS